MTCVVVIELHVDKPTLLENEMYVIKAMADKMIGVLQVATQCDVTVESAYHTEGCQCGFKSIRELKENILTEFDRDNSVVN